MSDAVPAEFAKLMVWLAAAYPKAELTEAQVRVYWAGLQDLGLDAIRQAMSRAVKEARWMPTVAELRSYVQPLPQDAAVLAWTALEQAAVKVGAFQSLRVEGHVAAEALLRVFGSWPAFCAFDRGPALGQKRAEFLVAYQDALRRGRHDGGWTRLPGTCEASGAYHNGAACWAGQVTATGQVLGAREAPQIAGETTVNRLTDGECETKET